ncbi:LLM class flavin-dependent oxidoreductase, partial [Staphylococcus arlettae]
TLRQVALEETTRKSPFFGTYKDVAQTIIDWFEAGAADGFIFGPHIYGDNYEEFINNVLPILEAKGYYDATYQGTTLRENIGVPFKANRYQQQSVEHTK